MAFLAVSPPTEQKLRRFLSFLSHSPSICRLWKGGRGSPPGVRGGDSSRGVTGGAAPAQAHSDTDPGLRGTPDQGCPKAMSPVSQAGKLVRDVDAAVRRARQLGPVSPWLLDTSPPPAPPVSSAARLPQASLTKVSATRGRVFALRHRVRGPWQAPGSQQALGLQALSEGKNERMLGPLAGRCGGV